MMQPGTQRPGVGIVRSLSGPIIVRISDSMSAGSLQVRPVRSSLNNNPFMINLPSKGDLKHMSIFWVHPATKEILSFKHHRDNIEEIDETVSRIRRDYDVYPCC